MLRLIAATTLSVCITQGHAFVPLLSPQNNGVKLVLTTRGEDNNKQHLLWSSSRTSSPTTESVDDDTSSSAEAAECFEEECAVDTTTVIIEKEEECLEEECAIIEECGIIDSMEKNCPPLPIDGIPGQDIIEEQPIRNPIDENSHVLVVGGSRGIGLEFVKQCLRKGAKVVATHREDVPPKTLETLMQKYGDNNLSCLKMDVGDGVSIACAAVELQSRRDGGNEFIRLTHIIHNAGTYYPGMSFDGTARGGRNPQPVVTEHDMMESFKINAVGPLLMAQSFVPLLGTASNRPPKDLPLLGILTSKVGSVYDNTSGGTYAYRASKSALNQIAKSRNNHCPN